MEGHCAHSDIIRRRKEYNTFKWFKGFCTRNPVTLNYGKVAPVNPKHVFKENVTVITQWFTDNGTITTSVSENLYNMDETGFNLFETNKAISMGQKKARHRPIDSSKSMYITSVNCIGTGGFLVPSMIIVPNLHFSHVQNDSQLRHKLAGIHSSRDV